MIGVLVADGVLGKLLSDDLSMCEILRSNFQMSLTNPLQFEIALISLKEGQIEITRSILLVCFGIIHRDLIHLFCAVESIEVVAKLLEAVIIWANIFVQNRCICKPYIGQIVTDQRSGRHHITRLLLRDLVACARLQ